MQAGQEMLEIKYIKEGEANEGPWMRGSGHS